MKLWNSPAGDLRLERHPFPGEKSHRPWDAADEWICRRFPKMPGSAVITGEAFGVLACSWGGSDVTAVNDSSLSLDAAEYNRSLNPEHCTGEFRALAVNAVSETCGTSERIFIRLPKDLNLLEIYINESLRLATGSADIWIGGMDRRWNSGVKKITDRLLLPAEIFPFERRARWIRFSRSESKTGTALSRPEAAGTGHTRKLEEYPVIVKHSPSVFSGTKTDPGTAAFLEAFPEEQTEKATVIADMGCGSGILGLAAAALNRNAELIFSDESFLAVAAAEENAEINGASGRSRFIVSNGLTGIPDESVDLVLCNPPFHFQNIQTIEPAGFMFSEAARVLKKGGTLQIVGNSHLGYHKHLKKYFRITKTVLRTPKFTVLRATCT